MLQDFKTEIKTLFIVALVAIVISFGGIFLLRGLSPAPIVQPTTNNQPFDNTQGEQPKFDPKETKLATIPADYKVSDIAFSPDGKQVAYVAEKQDNQFVVVDDKEERVYGWIQRIAFSPDSQQFAYIAHSDECDDLVVINEEEVICNNEFPEGEISDFVFSPDSKKIVLFLEATAPTYPKGFEVIDLKGNILYRHVPVLDISNDEMFISRKPFSFDSKQILYLEKRADKISFIVVDTNSAEETIFYEYSDSIYGIFLSPVFSTDSQEIAYVPWYEGGKGSTCGTFVIGREGKTKEGGTFDCYNEYPYDLGFTPQSKKVVYLYPYLNAVYAVIDDERIRLLIENREDYTEARVRQLVFIGNEQTYAYVVDKYYDFDLEIQKSFVRVNDREFGPYDFVGQEGPIVSLDMKYIGYGVRDGNELRWVTVDISKAK